MKKQKGFSILIIPIVVLILGIGGIFAYKVYTDSLKAKETDVPVVKVIPPLGASPGKPAKGYASVPGPASQTATMLVAEGTASGNVDLDILLGEVNDAGEADLKTLDVTVGEL